MEYFLNDDHLVIDFVDFRFISLSLFVLVPNGIRGGGPAERGKNLVVKADGRIISLSGKNSVKVDKGDRIRIVTPGGGGFGSINS